MAKALKLGTKRKKQKGKKQESESWLSAKVFALLGIIFFITQTLGLLIATLLIQQGVQKTPFTGNLNDVANAFYLFAAIISMTVVILIALRFSRKGRFLWLIEALAVFATTIIVFSALFPTDDLTVLIIALFIIAMRYTHRENLLIREVVSILAIVGAGSFIGISFGLLPIIAFVIILAVYDIIAVFGTKHMVGIGKAVTKRNFAFTVALPTKKHTFELGNGDLVIPLVVASSVLANGPFKLNALVAALCLAASFIGLMISIYTVSKKKIAMPALPPQTLLMLIVIGAALLWML